jgi:hypothetical protein
LTDGPRGKVTVANALLLLVALAIAYDGWIIINAPMGLSAEATVPVTPVNSSGFLYVVGGPLFSGTQLVLPPGSSGTLTIDCSSDNNLTQYWEGSFLTSLQQGKPLSYLSLTDVTRMTRTSIDLETVGVFQNETGLSFYVVAIDKISDFDYEISYNVTAAKTAPARTYSIPTPSGEFGIFHCYYLTVGTFPYKGTISAVPQAITLLLPLLAVVVVGIGVWGFRKVRMRTDSQPRDLVVPSITS